MKATRLLLALTSLAIAACSSSDIVGVDDPWEGIRLYTDRNSYGLGDEGILTLENGYRRAILAPFCPLRWDTLVEDAWEFAGPTHWVCAGPGLKLEPGESSSMPFTVHEDSFVSPGTFRFRITWHHAGPPPWGSEEGPPSDWPPWPWEVTTEGFAVEAAASLM